MSDNKTKKTAAQRISNLEESLIGTLRALSAMDNEQQIIKEALSLLGAKLDAVVQLLSSGQQLSDKNIGTLMVENKAQKLAANTQAMVDQGVLVKTDVVAEDSFIVGREVDADGTVVNPRLQFTAESTQKSLKPKLLGAKVLDKITVEEGKAALEVLEIYSIRQPQAPAPQAQA